MTDGQQAFVLVLMLALAFIIFMTWIFLAYAYNMTIDIEENELVYCYYGERYPACSRTEIDKDRFQLLNRLFEFLATGDLKD